MLSPVTRPEYVVSPAVKVIWSPRIRAFEMAVTAVPFLYDPESI